MATTPNNGPNPIDKVLDALQRLPFANKVLVFGSLAQGSVNPGDVDAVVDLRPLTRKEYLVQDPGGRELQPLLNIAQNLYGWFDPFLRFANDDLLVRSDDCRKWVRSENKAAMLASIDADARPLLEVLEMRLDSIVVASTIRRRLENIEARDGAPAPAAPRNRRNLRVL